MSKLMLEANRARILHDLDLQVRMMTNMLGSMLGEERAHTVALAPEVEEAVRLCVVIATDSPLPVTGVVRFGFAIHVVHPGGGRGILHEIVVGPEDAGIFIQRADTGAECPPAFELLSDGDSVEGWDDYARRVIAEYLQGLDAETMDKAAVRLIAHEQFVSPRYAVWSLDRSRLLFQSDRAGLKEWADQCRENLGNSPLDV